MESGMCCGTGCSIDYMRVWTSTAPDTFARNDYVVSGIGGGYDGVYTAAQDLAWTTDGCFSNGDDHIGGFVFFLAHHADSLASSWLDVGSCISHRDTLTVD